MNAETINLNMTNRLAVPMDHSPGRPENRLPRKITKEQAGTQSNQPLTKVNRQYREIIACNENFTICNGIVSACSGNFTICNEIVSACSGNFTICNEIVSTCNGNFTICDEIVSICNGNFTICNGIVTMSQSIGIKINQQKIKIDLKI